MALEVRAELVQRGTAGVAVDHHALPGRAAQQLVHRETSQLALNVPQRNVDGGDGGHRHRATTPVGAFVQVLPGVFDPAGVPADQQRTDMITKVGSHRQFAAVQGRITHSEQAVSGLDDQGDVVTAGRRDDHPGVSDLHDFSFVCRHRDVQVRPRQHHRAYTRSCLVGDPPPAFAGDLLEKSDPLSILAAEPSLQDHGPTTTYFMLWIIESTLAAPSAGLDLPKSTSVATGVNSVLKPDALGGVT